MDASLSLSCEKSLRTRTAIIWLPIVWRDEFPPSVAVLGTRDDFMELTQLLNLGETKRVKMVLIMGRLAAKMPNQSSRWL